MATWDITMDITDKKYAGTHRHFKNPRRARKILGCINSPTYVAVANGCYHAASAIKQQQLSKQLLTEFAPICDPEIVRGKRWARNCSAENRAWLL